MNSPVFLIWEVRHAERLLAALRKDGWKTALELGADWREPIGLLLQSPKVHPFLPKQQISWYPGAI